MTERGFTLLEVLVALSLLAGSLVVVADLMLVASRAGDASRETSLATALAAQKIEQLRSLARGMRRDGTAVDDHDTDVARWPDPASGGRGLLLSPPGTLSADTPGYVDYLDGAGRWLGADSPPTGPAVFARRWAIEPAEPSDPATLRLRVAVCRRVPAWRVRRPGTDVWLPVVEFEAAKTRRAE